MGVCPVAGVIWQHIHYVVGLKRLGHEVYYIEDTSRYPYNPVKNTVEADYRHAAGTLEALADRFDFREHWAFRPRYLAERTSAGLTSGRIDALYREADAVLNVCESHELNEDLARSRRVILVESDPVFRQVKVDQDDPDSLATLRGHSRLFTFGENIGTERFPVPLHGFEWLPTRQPIVTGFWEGGDAPLPEDAAFTTVTNWSAMAMVEWRKKPYLWSKSQEFMKFVDAPAVTGAPFELVTDIHDPATEALFRRHGWRLRATATLNLDVDRYRDYIQRSRGEFTATKQIVVALDTGWFSDRSACYLAAGRPVITQQTGFTHLYGGDGGLFAFDSMEEIAEAVRRIRADYSKHARAAREIALEYFEAEKVLKSLLDRAGL
jgi:hypothetical protein